MTRIVSIAAVCIACMTSFASAGEADFGARAGYLRIADSDDGAFLGGLFFRTDWRRVVFIDGSVYYHSEEIGGGTDLELIPIQLSAMLFLLGRDGQVSPFVLGGGGVYWTRTSTNGDTDSEFDLGWHLGFGADFELSDRMFVEADFRYMWLDADSGGQTFGDQLSSFNHWIAGLGLGFRL